jgi:hypothetical protein
MPKNEPEGKILKRRLEMRLLKILIRVKRILTVVLLIFLAGCASNYKDFKTSNVGDDEGVVIGKVSVAYKDSSYNTDLCEFCIGSTCHKLLKEGYVFMPLKSGESHSSLSLECHYTGGRVILPMFLTSVR